MKPSKKEGKKLAFFRPPSLEHGWFSSGCLYSSAAVRPLELRDAADPFSMDLGVTEKGGDIVKVSEVSRRRFCFAVFSLLVGSSHKLERK